MKRTKCTELTKLLGNCIRTDLINKLRTTQFSIVIDESTDVSTTKCMTVLVRFYDAEANKLKVGTLELIDICNSSSEKVGSTGENL